MQLKLQLQECKTKRESLMCAAMWAPPFWTTVMGLTVWNRRIWMWFKLTKQIRVSCICQRCKDINISGWISRQISWQQTFLKSWARCSRHWRPMMETMRRRRRKRWAFKLYLVTIYLCSDHLSDIVLSCHAGMLLLVQVLTSLNVMSFDMGYRL